MNYFYDVIINMNEENIFNFYEWENYDPIELVKKIPLFRVNTKTLKDFYMSNVVVVKEFLNTIMDKTVLKNNKVNKTIKYACLLCDTKNSLVVEFNDNGQVIGRSSLLLDDDVNVLEFIYSYRETKIDYIKNDNIKNNSFLRQEELIKKVVSVELKTIIENNNESKLKYLFNECFGYDETNILKMQNKINQELNSGISQKIKDIYDLIVLSYNKS